MRKLLLFTSGFTLSCLLCALFPGLKQMIWIGIAASVVIGLCFILLANYRRILYRVCLGTAIGLVWCLLYSLTFMQPARALTGTKVPLRGEVVAYSVEKSGGTRAEIRLTDGDASALASVFFSRNWQELHPGDRITGNFSLKLIRDESDGDNRLYANARGVVLTGFGELETVMRPDHIPFRYLPHQAAHALRESIRNTVPEDAAGFLIALLTADRSLLSEGAKSDFSISGISHIIAISGTHVSILIAFLVLVLGKGKRLTCIIGIPVILFFVFMTGGTPSVTRAAVMQIILLLSFPLDREDDPPTSISAAALLVLLWDPNSILQLSFLLSFGAVIGILLISGPVRAYLNGLPPIHALLNWSVPGKNRVSAFLTRRIRGFVRFVTSTIAATLGALLLTTPIMAIAFGSFSVYAVLTNLLVLWAVSICFIGGMLTALIGMAFQPIGAVFGAIIAIPVRYILWASHSIARLPFAVLSMRTAYGIGFLFFLYLVAGAALLLREKRLYLPLLTILGGLIITLCFVKLDLEKREFEICALDVGEGQCVCVVTPEFSVVFDCGGESGYDAGKRAAEHLRAQGLDRLDVLILSHYDNDHVNGAEILMQSIPVEVLYLADVDFSLDARRQIEQAAGDNEVEVRYVTEDVRLDYADGAVTLYAPVSRSSDNAASLAAWISVGAYDMMLTGDMDRVAEYDLIRTHSLPDVNLYIAGHHGAKNASSTELLEALQPEIVWISVGENKYGHPMDETLDRFAAIGAVVYRTDQSGNLTIGR